MSSFTMFITLLFLLLLLSTPTTTVAGRNSLFKVPGPMTRPPQPKPNSPHGYTTLRPRWTKKRHAFRGREVGNCLPKGFRPPPSAPSRYANYQTLGDRVCSSEPHAKP